MLKSITLTVAGDMPVDITVIVKNIQEIMAVNYKSKYRVQVVMLSGRAYYAYDQANNYEYNTLQDAMTAKEELISILNEE